MQTTHTTKHIYIVLTQTGTALSRLLKVITKAPYNHASISLTEDLNEMYSFGRRRPYNPFWAGFVVETPLGGTYKRFPQTEAKVLKLEVSEEAYQKIQAMIAEMVPYKRQYHYNYVGLVMAAFQIAYRPKNSYYCSEFVKQLLVQGGLSDSEILPKIVQPVHFLELKHTPLYQGKLKEYAVSKKETVSAH